MKSEHYKNILPWNEKEMVTNQFGWNPISVITPTASSKRNWEDAYLTAYEIKRSNYSTAKENNSFNGDGLMMSEFHAGLCENIVHYWSMVGDTIVDPFAGRLTRAFVSQSLGREYHGYDVSSETVKKVRHELDRHELDATIYEEDGCEMKSTPNDSANLVMTCPPYGDLEKYESAEGQLSDLRKYEDFCERIQVCGDNIERVLKPGGRFFCLEFSKIDNELINFLYRQYSKAIPFVGKYIVGSAEPYDYLIKSINEFYTQHELVALMKNNGFANIEYRNLSNGIAAIHSGWKI